MQDFINSLLKRDPASRMKANMVGLKITSPNCHHTIDNQRSSKDNISVLGAQVAEGGGGQTKRHSD